MKTLLITLTGILSCFLLQATPQQPDYLKYRGKKLSVRAGWGHPTPLQTYFQQTKTKYPFSKLSTGNYRGHVATWAIKEDRLYLTKIQIRDSAIAPNELAAFADRGKMVLADWFSGIIHAIDPNKYEDSRGLSDVFIQVRQGVVIGVVEFTGKDWEPNDDRDPNQKQSLRQMRMVKMNQNYITLYYRINRDSLDLNGEKCLLNVGSARLSPIFQYCDNDLSKWPYNWENISISGAPNPSWQIMNDSLFLVSFNLRTGLRFDGPEFIEADLDTLGIAFSQGERIFVSKVNGTYLISHGSFPEDKEKPQMYDFETTHYTLVNIERGLVVDSYRLDKDFNFANPPKGTDPRLIDLLKVY